jgi:hypothetical protein
VGFDACLMSQIDVLSAIAPYARYTVGSEETEPALGWAYAGFLGALVDDPAMDGGDLSAKIVETYIVEDGRITDEDARQVFAERVFNSAGISQEQAAEEMSGDITLTAVDLSKLDGINTALNELVMALTDVGQKKVSQARAYAQSYTNIFDKGTAPSFIDLATLPACWRMPTPTRPPPTRRMHLSRPFKGPWWPKNTVQTARGLLASASISQPPSCTKPPRIRISCCTIPPFQGDS